MPSPGPVERLPSCLVRVCVCVCVCVCVPRDSTKKGRQSNVQVQWSCWRRGAEHGFPAGKRSLQEQLKEQNAAAETRLEERKRETLFLCSARVIVSFMWLTY